MSRTLRRRTLSDHDKRMLGCLYGENSSIRGLTVAENYGMSYREYFNIYSNAFHRDKKYKFFVNYNTAPKSYRKVRNRQLRAKHMQSIKTFDGFDIVLERFIHNASWDFW